MFDLHELQESGLLHEINELVMWPHGLALTLDLVDGEPSRLFVKDFGEVIVSGLDEAAHAALHERLGAWCNARQVHP